MRKHLISLRINMTKPQAYRSKETTTRIPQLDIKYVRCCPVELARQTATKDMKANPRIIARYPRMPFSGFLGVAKSHVAKVNKE